MYGPKGRVLLGKDAYVCVLYDVIYAERASRQRALVRGCVNLTCLGHGC